MLFSYKGNNATSIPSKCCAVPYTLNGGLYYNCTVNAAVNSDFGCYHTNRQWVKCQQPDGMFMSPTVVVRNIAISVSVCLSVSLSVCPYIFKKSRDQILQNFLYMSRDDNVIRYVFPVLCLTVTSCFWYNGLNTLQSKTTRMFRQVHQVAAPGAKSAISDCILFVFIVIMIYYYYDILLLWYIIMLLCYYSFDE